MENLKYRFVIIGAGVSGLTTAYELSRDHQGSVLILEKDSTVGGLCKTVNFNSALYDLGSHRIHWHPKPKPFELIKRICGAAVIKNIRGGKLRIKKAYVNYPIISFEFFFGIGIIESFLCAISLFNSIVKNKFFNKGTSGGELNYEGYISKKAGLRAYQLFYEPYAKKVWGIHPSLISLDAVKKRISMIKPTQFVKHVFRNYLMKINVNFYYYLKNGMGTFADGLRDKILENKCRITTGINDYVFDFKNGNKIISFKDRGKEVKVEFEKLISTAPIDDLITMLSSDPEICSMAKQIRWRGLKLVYLHIKGEPKRRGETFYFPELKYVFGRVSIPKRFSGNTQPVSDYTCFTCEIPCSENDDLWNMPDKEAYDLCLKDLQKAQLLNATQEYVQEKNFIINIPKVYPVYTVGWEKVFLRLMDYLVDKFPDIYVSGKPGLFMHCNLDHSIDIGLSLAEHIRDNKTAREWSDKARVFKEMKIRD